MTGRGGDVAEMLPRANLLPRSRCCRDIAARLPLADGHRAIPPANHAGVVNVTESRRSCRVVAGTCRVDCGKQMGVLENPLIADLAAEGRP